MNSWVSVAWIIATIAMPLHMSMNGIDQMADLYSCVVVANSQNDFLKGHDLIRDSTQEASRLSN